MAINTTDFPELMEKILHQVFFHEHKDPGLHYKMAFNVFSTNKRTETDSGITGTSALVQRNEGSPVTFDEPKERNKQTYVQETYSLGIRTTWDLMRFSQYREIAQQATSLGRSAIQTKNDIAFNVFDNGFDSDFTGPDGVELFSRIHPLENSASTNANELTVAAALSATSLQNLLNVMDRTVDSSNNNLQIEANMLLIPSELRFTARELLKSAGLPGTANNNINSLLAEGLSDFATPFLSSTTAWFILSKRNALKMFESEQFDVRSWTDDKTRDVLTAAWVSFRVGFSDYRGVAGTAGA